MRPLLETRGLSVSAGGRMLCEGLDLLIRPGQSWALLGRNGAGKTTLLHHLAGLRPVGPAQVFVDGEDLAGLGPRQRARRVGILLQHSSRGFGASVLDTVLSGRHPHLSTLAWENASDLAIATQCIQALDLSELGARSLDTLSGGELRRVEIARLLAQQTPLSLLDEPTNHLDLAHQAACLRTLLTRCVDARRAMLMVVHDLNLAYRACDHWLLLDGDGGWHAGAREELSDPMTLSRAYGHPISCIGSEQGPVFVAQM